MAKRYIKIEWPDYQYFMGKPNVYFCADDNTYFVPEELVNDKLESSSFSNSK